MLGLVLRPGERIYVGGNIWIEVLHSSATRCELGIEAPREIPVIREQVVVKNGIDVGSLPMVALMKPAIAEPEVAEPHISQEKHDAA